MDLLAGRATGRFDLAGAISAMLGSGAPVFGFISSAGADWDSPKTIVPLAVAVILLALFVVGSIPWSPLDAGLNNVPMAPIALAWVLRNPVVDSVLSGATKPHHLTDAVAALDIELSVDEVHALEGPYVPRAPTYFA